MKRKSSGEEKAASVELRRLRAEEKIKQWFRRRKDQGRGHLDKESCRKKNKSESSHSSSDSWYPQAELEQSIREHMKVEEKLMASFHEDIAATKNAVVIEAQERERHDLELAAALERYITKLQSSLHIVNSTDT